MIKDRWLLKIIDMLDKSHIYQWFSDIMNDSIMFLSNSSIDDLNKKKDHWKSIEIENKSTTTTTTTTTIELKISADGNARCPLVTIDQDMGVLDPYNHDEPLRTLKILEKLIVLLVKKNLFATYAVTNPKDIGKFISVADKINILQVAFSSNHYSKISKKKK
ncbi:hypothetical protein ACTFIZ_012072 [Dictyostelium cf. discoideum]